MWHSFIWGVKSGHLPHLCDCPDLLHLCLLRAHHQLISSFLYINHPFAICVQIFTVFTLQPKWSEYESFIWGFFFFPHNMLFTFFKRSWSIAVCSVNSLRYCTSTWPLRLHCVEVEIEISNTLTHNAIQFSFQKCNLYSISEQIWKWPQAD